MKVLWITNILFPEAEILLTKQGVLRSSGGWMLGAADALLRGQYDVSLSVATVSSLVKELTVLHGQKMTYYVLPFGKGNVCPNPEFEPMWKIVNEQCRPDVVHIHGTEYSHGLAYINACGGDSVAVSVQGLKSGIAPYYCAGLTPREIYKNITFRDFVRGSIIADQRIFHKSAYEVEKPMLCKVKHVIGRTSWDRSHVWAINPSVTYHFCNETLRSEFYDGSRWNYNGCEKHTIFLSQGSYPLKGLHQMLRAMPLILRAYPNACIKVAGHDITKANSLKEKVRLSGYGKIIKGMISQMHLEGHIEFLGPLNAEQMKQAYLNSNVFVCPSSIENSPNSLGEAQILGVPCVASYVGGIPDMMQGNEENLYRFEEIEMLAEKVCRIFSNGEKQVDMRRTAFARHNPDENAKQLYKIYNCIK